MPVYVNRNVKGNWKKVEVSDAEVSTIRKINFESNLKMCKMVLKKVNDDVDLKKHPSMLKEIATLLCDRMTTPLHYAIENHVDAEFAKEAAGK